MLMSMRRFTRLMKAFSKKVENGQEAAALDFTHYQFVRMHSKLRVTPAIKAGVSDRPWSLHDLVEQAST